MNPLQKIRHLDYTVVFARDMDAMRRFSCSEVMDFPSTTLDIEPQSEPLVRLTVTHEDLDNDPRCSRA